MKRIKLIAFLTAILTCNALVYVGCGESDTPQNSMELSSKSDSSAAGDIAEAAEGADAADEAGLRADDAADDADVGEFAGVDAVYAEAAPDGMADIGGSADEISIPAEAPGIIDDPEIAIDDPASIAGLLTAAEWRDHDNWGLFSNLVNSGTISFPSYGIDPTQRISVSVVNEAGAALPNQTVELLDASDDVIWTSVSDENGTAYLFETNGRIGTALQTAGQRFDVAAAASDGIQGERTVSDRAMTVTLASEPQLYNKTQVMFILDTTGSMSDEMLYLQSDFSAIVNEVGDAGTTYSVNFYRDEGDDYVTKCSGFTSDPQEITRLLNNESAEGGGDIPEAVAEALHETLSGGDWDADAVKVAFLIFDAPPHSGKEDVLQQAIQDASAKGIHLVPVVSSNTGRDTELFGRAVAICTNGTYVFLTDDSGIGDSHLEPIVGDYEVESLHDIIVRIIDGYKQ